MKPSSTSESTACKNKRADLQETIGRSAECQLQKLIIIRSGLSELVPAVSSKPMSIPLRFCCRNNISKSAFTALRFTRASSSFNKAASSVSVRSFSVSARKTGPKVNLGPAGEADMDTIKNTIAENFGGSAQDVGTHQFSLEQVPDQTGKVALVTGGSEGIGYACTHTLLSKNISKVFILSVSKEVVDGAKDAIAKEMGQETADKTVWIQCDISDWKRVAEVANQIQEQTDRLDILINNAARGIMTYQLTDYGVDRHMALNHMGHVTLTSHLLPLLKKTAENEGNTVRIVNLSSNAHQAAPKDTKFASLDELNQDLGPNGQYGRSKLANLLHARYLARKVTPNHPRILANATHPGFVATKMSEKDIHEPYPLGGYAMSVGLQPFKKDQFEGCLSTVFAATATDKSGEYICPPAVPEAGSELANDEQLQDQLMKLTREIIMEKTKKDSSEKGCPFDDVVLH